MPARAGMLNLISRLRSMTEAGTADYAIDGTTYWSDEQLQAVLDRYRQNVTREPLDSISEYVAGGTLEYRDYYSAHKTLEEAASGSAAWDLEDSTGATISTADYTVNYDAGHIRFSADTDGEAYYLTARTYSLPQAAAEVWERKAAHVASAYNFASDGARFDRGQMQEHYLSMAAHYSRRAGVRVGRLFRSDAT